MERIRRVGYSLHYSPRMMDDDSLGLLKDYEIQVSSAVSTIIISYFAALIRNTFEYRAYLSTRRVILLFRRKLLIIRP